MIEEIRQRLSLYQPREVDSEERPQAGVLLALYQSGGELHVILTRRTDTVQSHKGEVSFPGGAREDADFDLSETALRESQEEIGLKREHVTIIGRLDDIITISSFHVQSYVGIIEPALSPYPWQPQESEVAEILEVPLTHLLEPSTIVEFQRVRDGNVRLMRGYRFGDHVVWGATGAILRNFLDVALSGQALESASTQ